MWEALIVFCNLKKTTIIFDTMNTAHILRKWLWFIEMKRFRTRTHSIQTSTHLSSKQLF